MNIIKKTLLLLLLAAVQGTIGQAQNLVPNPSFEDTTNTGCPDGVYQSILPNGWSSYNLTPDYFNACSPPLPLHYNSVPGNGWGYQLPYSGNAYCGAWFYQTDQFNTREYIGRQLSIPMMIGQKYFTTFKVSLAGNSNCGIDKIGILFSTVPYINNYLIPAPITDFAHVLSTAIITDTLNWTNISGSFIADSTYQYIIIGNFFDDGNTDTIILGGLHSYGYGSYYFIDDIYVGTDSLIGVEPYYTQDIINIYPNPTHDKIYVGINNVKKISCSVINMFGEQVKSSNNTVIDLSELPAGFYYLQIRFDEKNVIYKIALIK